MRKWKKTSAALMAAVLAAASMLGGCGNAASETAQSGTTAQEASVSQGTENGTEAGTEAAGTGSTKIADGDVTLTIWIWEKILLSRKFLRIPD